MRQRGKSVTIMFVPDGDGRTVSMRVQRTIVWTLAVFAVLFLGGMACLVLIAGDIAVRLQLVRSLQQANAELRQDNAKLRETVRKIDDIRRINEYLSRLLQASGSTAAVPPRQGTARAMLFDKDSLGLLSEPFRTAGGAVQQPAPAPSTSSQEADAIAEAIPYLRPVEGWITKTFSAADSSNGKEHTGVDFAAATGAIIRAAAPGVAVEVKDDLYYGKTVTLEHKYGFRTRYGHCSQILVSEGAHVRRGQTIALVGNTGHSSAPHLHYEVIKDGMYVDPMRYILSRQR